MPNKAAADHASCPGHGGHVSLVHSSSKSDMFAVGPAAVEDDKQSDEKLAPIED